MRIQRNLREKKKKEKMERVQKIARRSWKETRAEHYTSGKIKYMPQDVTAQKQLGQKMTWRLWWTTN